jgi:hypothetical protein
MYQVYFEISTRSYISEQRKHDFSIHKGRHFSRVQGVTKNVERAFGDLQTHVAGKESC